MVRVSGNVFLNFRNIKKQLPPFFAKGGRKKRTLKIKKEEEKAEKNGEGKAEKNKKRRKEKQKKMGKEKQKKGKLSTARTHARTLESVKFKG